MRAGKTKSKEQLIYYGEYIFSPGEWVRYGAEGVLLGTFIVWICYRDLRAAFLVIPIAAVWLRNKNKSLCEKRRRLLLYHFREFLGSFYSGMRAGYSMENSTSAAAKDMQRLYGKEDPMVRELKEILKKCRLQIPIEEAFYDFGRRSGLEDIYHFSEIVMISKKSGGDTGKILQACYRAISEKMDTEKEIRTGIASQQYEQQIMSIMPAAIVLYLRLSFSALMNDMYGNPAGAAFMTAALLVYCFAFFWGKKIVRIEV